MNEPEQNTPEMLQLWEPMDRPTPEIKAWLERYLAAVFACAGTVSRRKAGAMPPAAAPISAPDGALIALPRSPAEEAHRVIAEAIAHYRSTHALGDTPRLHVSREAWDAIVNEHSLTVTNPSCVGPNEYAGCPVTVSNFADRPGIWCDAMPQKPRLTATEARNAVKSEQAAIDGQALNAMLHDWKTEVYAKFPGVSIGELFGPRRNAGGQFIGIAAYAERRQVVAMWCAEASGELGAQSVQVTARTLPCPTDPEDLPEPFRTLALAAFAR